MCELFKLINFCRDMDCIKQVLCLVKVSDILNKIILKCCRKVGYENINYYFFLPWKFTFFTVMLLNCFIQHWIICFVSYFIIIFNLTDFPLLFLHNTFLVRCILINMMDNHVYKYLTVRSALPGGLKVTKWENIVWLMTLYSVQVYSVHAAICKLYKCTDSRHYNCTDFLGLFTFRLD